MRDQRGLSGAVTVSTDNLVRAGMPLVEDIALHWPAWEAGVGSGTP